MHEASLYGILDTCVSLECDEGNRKCDGCIGECSAEAFEGERGSLLLRWRNVNDLGANACSYRHSLCALPNGLHVL